MLPDEDRDFVRTLAKVAALKTLAGWKRADDVYASGPVTYG